MQKKTKKAAPLSPQAAKVLEQYRNAGKTPGNSGSDIDPADDGANPAVPRQNAAPPGASAMRRSGTRGK